MCSIRRGKVTIWVWSLLWVLEWHPCQPLKRRAAPAEHTPPSNLPFPTLGNPTSAVSRQIGDDLFQYSATAGEVISYLLVTFPTTERGSRDTQTPKGLVYIPVPWQLAPCSDHISYYHTLEPVQSGQAWNLYSGVWLVEAWTLINQS